MSVNEEYFFACPYCGVENFIIIDFSFGKSQSFVNDCENCCRPIEITLKLQGTDVVYFSADME